MKGSVSSAKSIAFNGLIAALYFVLTIVSSPIAYGQIQFRIAEILVLLCFWRPDLIVGVTLGCFLANINSSLGPWDMLFGTLATFLSAIGVALSPRLFIGAIFPIAINAFVVGAELFYLADLPFWISAGYVAIGEGVVIIVSYILWVLLVRHKNFMNVLAPIKHQTITY
jgi:uncharacterized membrane protein